MLVAQCPFWLNSNRLCMLVRELLEGITGLSFIVESPDADDDWYFYIIEDSPVGFDDQEAKNVSLLEGPQEGVQFLVS